jgi:radical SAM protein with 4Fe4S-binding SPASM domain
MEYPAGFILRDFPMHLDIEATSRCNLRCTFCDKLPQLAKGQFGDMDMVLYKKIIDEGARNNLWGVKLSYRGEPLLHKGIVEMVSYAKKNGILDVYFNTNGMLLTRSMSEQLLDAGLDRISISIEGTEPEQFERHRVGARFDVIIKNIDDLLEARKKRGSAFPKLRIQTVYFPGMDVERYKDFWSKRCDEVAAIDYKDGANLKTGLTHDWACPQLWQRMTIQWDGSVSPCNNDDRCLLVVGNINERTVRECWHDNSVNDARRLHKEGASHKVPACNGCPWRTAQINKIISGGQGA